MFHQTAESLFRQSLQQWEWIIVDCGSDEAESLANLAGLASQDSRIRVIRSERRCGHARALNLAAAQARAPYLAFLGSHDLYEPTALEKLLWFLESHPACAAVTGFQARLSGQGPWREGFHSGSALLRHNTIRAAPMIRCEVFRKAGGVDENLDPEIADWDFWLKCAAAGYWGGTVPEFLEWKRGPAAGPDLQQETEFRARLPRRFPKLLEGAFPVPADLYPAPDAGLTAPSSFENCLGTENSARRLLILVPHLALGGADKFVLDLMSELIKKHRYEVTIAATLAGPQPWRHHYEALTPDVFTLATFLRFGDFPRFLAYLIRSRAVESVLVTHSELGYRVLPYLRAQFPGVRFYDYVHIEEPAWKSGGYPAMSAVSQPFLHHTAASSQHLRTWMEKQGARGEKISVVTTNVDTEAWRRDRYDLSALRRKWEAPEGIPVILFAGRVCIQKQPDILAHAIQLLEQRQASFLCLVAGGGQLEEWLRDFVRNQSMSRLRLLGPRGNDEIKELLALSDIFFLPSRHEGIALAIYEAMAMEVVPVSADVGGQAELVTPDCGVLIARGGDQATRYADALERLLKDPGLRTAMAAAARSRVAKAFRLEQMGDDMAAVLQGRRDQPPEAELGELPEASVQDLLEQYRLHASRGYLAELQLPPPPNPAIGMLVIQALGILRPLLMGRADSRNRGLLFRTLWHASRRRQLLAAFDHRFYCVQYPDVPRVRPLPLLHYLFCGYREGRLPSPSFDNDDSLLHPEEAGPGAVNPLLRKICAHAAR